MNKPSSIITVALLEIKTLLDKLKSEEIDRRDSIDALSETQDFYDCVANVEYIDTALKILNKIK